MIAYVVTFHPPTGVVVIGARRTLPHCVRAIEGRQIAAQRGRRPTRDDVRPTVALQEVSAVRWADRNPVLPNRYEVTAHETDGREAD